MWYFAAMFHLLLVSLEEHPCRLALAGTRDFIQCQYCILLITWKRQLVSILCLKKSVRKSDQINFGHFGVLRKFRINVEEDRHVHFLMGIQPLFFKAKALHVQSRNSYKNVILQARAQIFCICFTMLIPWQVLNVKQDWGGVPSHWKLEGTETSSVWWCGDSLLPFVVRTIILIETVHEMTFLPHLWLQGSFLFGKSHYCDDTKYINGKVLVEKY